jgi:hypothetical protein
MSTTTTINDSASRVIRGLKDSVSGQVGDQKQRAAEGIIGMAEAVRRLSDEIRGHNEPLANAVGSAGSKLEGVAGQLRDADPADMARAVATFARNQPLLFVGAAFVAGLGVSHLLKNAAMMEGSSPTGDSAGNVSSFEESSVGA